jgi:hypothetical protein
MGVNVNYNLLQSHRSRLLHPLYQPGVCDARWRFRLTAQLSFQIFGIASAKARSRRRSRGNTYPLSDSDSPFTGLVFSDKTL